MKKLMALVIALALMALCLPSAFAATKYLDGYMIAEIGGVEYEFYQTKSDYSNSNRHFSYVCYDENGKALFDLIISFDDDIKVGEYCTEDDPYDRSGLSVSLTEYFHEGGWHFDRYVASFHDLSKENPNVFMWDQERGYVYMNVEEKEDDYYYGYFGAFVAGRDDYGYEIYASFCAEVA